MKIVQGTDMARSASYYLEFKGVTLSLTDWADLIGVPVQTIYYRIKKGWPRARVLTGGRGRRSSRLVRRTNGVHTA